MLHIELLPALRDNYIHLIHDPETGETAAVDPADASVVLDALARRDWKLNLILNTHHHADHVDGNLELKARTGCRIVGAAHDAARIPGIDTPLTPGQTLAFGRTHARVLDLRGHTMGHIGYWFAGDSAAFVGDTLFSLGAGRLFEGTAQDMWGSLQRINALPAGTRLFCAHEYTEANGRFALGVDPHNPDLVRRMTDVRRLIAERLPTLPTTLAQERSTNPFLRANAPAIRIHLGLESAHDWEVFAELRRRKDRFQN